MTDPVPLDQPAPLDQPWPEECSDLEYDLAHEATTAAGSSQPTRPARPTYVATQTADYDGDYGYDLAHDVPKP